MAAAETLRRPVDRRTLLRGAGAAIFAGTADALLTACGTGTDNKPSTSASPRTEQPITPIPFETLNARTNVTIGTLIGGRPFAIPSDVEPGDVGSRKAVQLQTSAEVVAVERTETNAKPYDTILADLGYADGGRILFISTPEQRDRLARKNAKIPPGREDVPPDDPDAQAFDRATIEANRDFLNRYDRATLEEIQKAGPPELIDISLFVVVPK
jgi:hypothetical protein